jgi:hypothetical protein
MEPLTRPGTATSVTTRQHQNQNSSPRKMWAAPA